MGASTRCEKGVLAQGRRCKVTRCGHGTLHLAMGSLTLHLTPAQLGDLAATLGAAHTRLEAPEVRPADALLC